MINRQKKNDEETYPAIFDVLRLTLNIKMRVNEQVENVESDCDAGATYKELYFGDETMIP